MIHYLRISVQNVVPIHLVHVEIFHWITENFDLPVVLEGQSEITKVIRIHPLENHPILIEIFQPGLKWWTEGQIERQDISISRGIFFSI